MTIILCPDEKTRELERLNKLLEEKEKKIVDQKTIILNLINHIEELQNTFLFK